MILSIIIPYYNADKYIYDLLDCLEPQVTKDTEVILVDDGSEEPFDSPYEDWLKVIRQKNAGPSAARNTGIEAATGKYISFIDADDLVADNYIEKILETIKAEKFDFCLMSWKTLPGPIDSGVKLSNINNTFPSWNVVVWNRVYKKSYIGKHRFNQNKRIAEDAEFIKAVGEHGKKAIITDYMYFYRADTPGSLTKQFHQGTVDHKKIVYYYPTVTADMKDLLKEVKKEYKTAEVVVMTNRNDIPELEKYAMIIKPQMIVGSELRGENTPLFKPVPVPVKCQVLMIVRGTQKIGGIETFVYNFCKIMRKYYDICVLYDSMNDQRLEMLRRIVRCEQYKPEKTYACDTLMLMRFSDRIPENVSYKKSVQMVHACKMHDWMEVPEDRDEIVCVSETARKTFPGLKAKVIHNLVVCEGCQDALLLVSATRLASGEKGHDRIIRLAEALNRQQIPFTWLIFTDTKFAVPENVHLMPSRIDIMPFLSAASYVAQLSNSEAFCYSIVEALCCQTPVICTDLPVLPEIGVKDGINGYVLPFDGEYDSIVRKIYEQPLKGRFHYSFNNTERVGQWIEILGPQKPFKKYDPAAEIQVVVKSPYWDTVLKESLSPGMIRKMARDRAETAQKLGLIQIM